MASRDLQAEKILSSGKNNKPIPGGLPQTCLKAAFESSKTFGLFTSYFDEELYHYAADYYDTHVFGRDRPMYAILGVAKVLEDVAISQRNYSPYRDMQRFLEQDFCLIHKGEQMPDKFRPFLTARIDIKLLTAGNDFQIVSASDEKARIEKPAWFNKDGIGYVIHSYVGKLEFAAKPSVDGKIRLWLRGSDIRTPEDRSKRIPFWIDYTKLTINDKVIFDKVTPAWHDKAYYYNMDVKAGAEIKIQVEWLPHKSKE